MLADRLIEGLDKLDVTIVSPQETSERTSIVTCHLGENNPVEVLSKLKKHGIIAHKRQNFIRFAPHVYNSLNDIERTINALEEIL